MINHFELIPLSIGLRWMIFEYKNTYRFRFWLATLGATDEDYNKIPVIRDNEDITPQMWKGLQRQVMSDPATLAELLGHNLRAELLDCAYCQTIEAATVILFTDWILSASTVAQSILHWGLWILLAGLVGMLVNPVIVALVGFLEGDYTVEVETDDHANN